MCCGRSLRAYWAAVLEACPSNLLTYLRLCGSVQEEDEADEEALPCLTLDVLRPCTAFTELRGLEVEMKCPVSLTDADLLELVSPRMGYFLINHDQGWQINAEGGGIMLSGLVQLLRQRPSLHHLCLGIDTWTFTDIPEELDVSFPLRQLKINLLDSYILSKFVPGLVSVFAALGLEPCMLTAWGSDCDSWKRVSDELRDHLERNRSLET